MTTELVQSVDADFAALRTMVDTFIETGVARLPYAEWYSDQREGEFRLTTRTTFRKYLRSIARTHKRPFVIVEGGRFRQWLHTPGGYKREDEPNGFHATVTSPNTRAMAPVLAPLLLLTTDHVATRVQYESGVWRVKGKRIERFNFNGNESEKHFNAWLERLSTNKECREALKLPAR